MARDTSDTQRPTFIEWLMQTSRALGYARDSDLARALEVDQSVISRWKKGSQPSVKHLATISELTGTPITALLVLAGYLPPTRERLDKAIAVISTPGERVITEAQMPAVLKNELRTYWDQRMKEELSRLVQLVHIVHRTADGKLKSAKILDEIAAKVFPTKLPNHVADLLTASADVIDRLTAERDGSPGKESLDAGEEGAEAEDARQS